MEWRDQTKEFMNETKHTPGPWEVHIGPDLSGLESVQVGADGDFVCLCGTEKSTMPGGMDRIKANAALIASAPQLLAERDALKVALVGIEHIADNCGKQEAPLVARQVFGAAISEMRRIARAALALGQKEGQ